MTKYANNCTRGGVGAFDTVIGSRAPSEQQLQVLGLICLRCSSDCDYRVENDGDNRLPDTYSLGGANNPIYHPRETDGIRGARGPNFPGAFMQSRVHAPSGKSPAGD